ncbi:hypothetical protein [uncultured Mucilaginibacter sp.]|uniref:hypothetical protein n=1 Tax=uncultured Mucilaginibacter sp. TaxID=797541 RepID=UPI0025FD8251|nr:hypothetical protein [uncultured Mucilaginibacter sp.]
MLKYLKAINFVVFLFILVIIYSCKKSPNAQNELTIGNPPTDSNFVSLSVAINVATQAGNSSLVSKISSKNAANLLTVASAKKRYWIP